MRRSALLLLSLPCVFFTSFTTLDAHAQSAPVGTTIEYAYDGMDVNKPDRAWWGRAYLHPTVLDNPDVPRPVVVLLHGINKAQTKYPWMGREGSPDLRPTWDSYIRDGHITPAVLAAPSATVACTLPHALWTGFDLDRFLALTIRATRGQVRLDLNHVIVVGHSGAGCNPKGGLVTAMQSSLPIRAILAIDVCMNVVDAEPLAQARSDTDVVITYQPQWKRDFEGFRGRYLESSQGATGLRQVEEMLIPGRRPHSVIVKESLDRWLPRWLPNHEILSI